MSFDLALINSDLDIKADGTIRTVEKTDKLSQDIVKIILTPINSMRFHEWYGSAINEGTIGNVLPDNILFNDISIAISDSLQRLMILQRAQSAQQRVDPSELIASIAEVNVGRNASDPRQINVVVRIISQNLTPVEETFSIGS